MKFTRLTIIFLTVAVMMNCREPYRDLALEVAWGDELRESHSKYIRCPREAENAYLELLSARLLAHVEFNPYEFKFCLTDQDIVNAYALPAGSIYVHRGLIRDAPSESALVFVLGHELSHVLLRHAFRRKKKQKAAVEAMKRIPTRALAGPARLFGAAGLLKFSRRFEKDADLKALELTHRAGYDPRGGLEFLEVLRTLDYRRPGVLRQMFSTHPRPSTRLRYVRRRLGRMRPRDYYREPSPDFIALQKRLKK